MKIHILLFVFLSSILEAQSLRIATYNVENLFDMQHSGLEYKAYIPNRHNWTEAILTKKLNHIAEVICDMDVDVIGLQEVENDRVLEKLQKVLKRVGCDYPYRTITDTKQTPIHNALLSKIAIKKRKDITIYRTGRQRSILEVELKSEPKLTLFVNHWKSKAGPESKRIPYAKAMAKRITSLTKGSEYIILGDFNSDYHEFQVMDAKHNDTSGITGVNHILKTISVDKMVRLGTLSSGYHYTLWMEVPSYARWSHNFYGDKEGIDAIIIPSTLHNGLGWEYKKGSFGVFKPDYLFGKRGRIKRWEYKHSKHTGKGYSDHLPVYATFETGAKRTNTHGSTKGLLSQFMSIFASDTSVSLLVSDATQKVKNNTTSTGTISQIIEMEKILKPVKLNSVKVIFKSRDTAIIKQSPQGRAILLYRSAGDMQVGHAYDIIAHLKKRYKGLDELVDITVERERGMIDIDLYRQKFVPEMMKNSYSINEVIYDVEGTFHKRKIIVDGMTVPIYFKKGIKRPSAGSYIRIKRAQIGYYKNHNELVVWDKNDYQILE